MIWPIGSAVTIGVSVEAATFAIVVTATLLITVDETAVSEEEDTNPPVENTKFTFYLVDVTNSLSSSIAGVVQLAGIEIKLVAGTNQSTSTAILLHDNINDVGIPDTTQFVPYGTNITLNYILDSLNDDRLLVTSLVGAEIF